MPKYAHTTIEEDLLSIERIFDKIRKNQADLPVVNIIDKKPGLDDMNGKYLISGAVVLGKVTTRGKNSRSGEACGYKVSRLLMNDEGEVLLDNNNQPTIVETMLVSKEQGIELTNFMGSRNSYIRIQEKKDSSGNPIKNIVYLRPYPSTTQAFFLDGRVEHVYETDEYGERMKPITLRVKREDCTSKLWLIINSDFSVKSRREKPKKNMVESRKENERRINSLKETLIQTNNAMVNPFK